MKHRHLASLAVAFFCLASFAEDEKTIIVDVRAGTVDEIDLRQSGPSLLAKLGSRVKKTTELLEGGEPNDLFIVSFHGHEIRKHAVAFSFTDPVFRTKEGLGVGSTVEEFEKIYGRAVFSEAEGCHWQIRGESVYLVVVNGCDSEPSRKRPVTEVSVW